MFSSQRIRARKTLSVVGGSSAAGSYGLKRAVQFLVVLLCSVTALKAQAPFQIASATYGTAGASSVPAGVNGAVLTMSGTLPNASQEGSYLGCFYTGSGSMNGIALTPPNDDGTEQITIPASTIQNIPQGSFTAANNYSVTALLYFIASDASCDGNAANAASNQFPVQVVAPGLGAYSGPTSVPQTNAATNVPAAPVALVLPASGYLTGAASGGTSSIMFGTFGSVNVTGSGAAVYVPVPAAFSLSAVGTTAALSICNTLTGNTTPVCTTPTPAITLTVVALAASTGTVTATPTPVNASQKTVLTAQFGKASAGAGNPGAPSGTVTFVADGTTLPAANLVLDTSATFVGQSSTIAATAAATPAITPAAGSYLGAQTITITDPTAGAAIYYTQDGSTPTNASTVYAGPFSISSSETVKAIAAVPGLLDSAVASAAYVVTIRPPTQLAFQVQPVDTALNTAITPAVRVAIEDATGAVVTSSSAPVTIGLRSNPGEATLGGTTTVNAVNGIATFANLTLSALTPGTTVNTLYASSTGLTGVESNGFKIVPPAITMTVQSELVGIGSTLNGGFTLGAPAPAGGLVVSLTSGTPANVTVAPASVTVAAGQTTGVFTYSGVAAGDSTLTATATGYQTGTVLTTGTAAQVSLGMIPNVAPAQMQSLALSLATPAPAGGTTVTFTIANPNIATVTTSVFIPAGQQTPAANPQVTGVLIGTTTVTANAPGYAPATRPVVVTVTAAVNPGTTYINLTTSTNTILQISAPAPPGGITFNLTSDDPTIARVPATVTLVKGATSANLTITGLKDGTTTIRATSPGVAEADGTVTVNSTIQGGSFTGGYNLQQNFYQYLPVGPANPVTVTVTSNDPTVAVISASNTTVGKATITFPNTTSTGVGSIWVQGLKVGSTTLTISAPGYTTGTETITIDPSGFYFYYNGPRTTTTYSQPDTNYLYPVPLNQDGTIESYGTWYLNAQSAAISVPVTSSSTAIGTVNSPVVFHPNDTSEAVNLTPVGVGTATITVGTPPAGFAVASQNASYMETVSAPVIAPSAFTTGTRLQNSLGIYLPIAPPTGHPVTVTVTSGTPGVATLSTSATTAGTATLTFTNVTSSYVGTIYVQGQSVGTSTLTESAPGYTTGTSTLTVDKSGFAFYYSDQNFATTTFSGTSTATVYTAVLDPTTQQILNFQYPLNPGVGPVTVPLTDSDTTVATISPAALTFNTGDSAQNVTIQPVAAGTANITLSTPTGFSTPMYQSAAQNQRVIATVTAPAIQVSSIRSGVHLQNSMGLYLPVAPPTGHPVTVTVTTSAPLVGTMSNSSTVAGVTTLTFPNVSSTYIGTIYLQGQSVGTTTITESAPGYTSGTGTFTVLASGFAFYYIPTYTTTTFSSPTTSTVYTTILDPTTYQIQDFGYALNPGVGPVTVSVTDSATSVGTISANALVFNTGDSSQSFTFKPVSAGTANLSINTPTGFSTPLQSQNPNVPQNQAGTVTVTAPAISISNVTTGVNLDYSIGIYLPQTPPNPVTVTVTSSGPAIGTISSDPTVVGTQTVTFTNVTSQNVGTIYVQGQSLGTEVLTETAPGYTDGSSTLTVYPSGFAFYGSPGYTTSVANGPTAQTVYACVLNPGVLTVEQFNIGINPGIGSISVPVTSSDTTVGTIVTSPVVFGPGVGAVNFEVQPVGTGTATYTIGNPSPPTGFSTPSQYQAGTVTVQ